MAYNKQNKAVFITARLNSSRLPNKHMLNIAGKHCIEYVIDRAKLVSEANLVVLCTTHLDEDDVLENIGINNDILVYRGSVKDKLDRWCSAAKHFDVDFFVTAGGDNLFSEPKLLNMAIKQYKKTNADLINWEGTGVICGAFGYGVSVSALKKIVQNKTTCDTELEYDFFKTGEYNIEPLKNIPEVFRRPDIRATLDYPEDFKFFKTTIELAISLGVDISSLQDIVKMLDAHPHIIRMNQFRHEDWKKNQEKHRAGVKGKWQ